MAKIVEGESGKRVPFIIGRLEGDSGALYDAIVVHPIRCGESVVNVEYFSKSSVWCRSRSKC